MRFGPDGEGVPEEFAFAFRGIAPSGLVGVEAFLDAFFRLAKEHGDVLDRVEAVGNKKWDHDDVLGVGGCVSVCYERGFLHEGGLNVGIIGPGTDGFDLYLDRFAGVFVFSGSMAGDEKGRFILAWRAWKGVLLNYVSRS